MILHNLGWHSMVAARGFGGCYRTSEWHSFLVHFFVPCASGYCFLLKQQSLVLLREHSIEIEHAGESSLLWQKFFELL